MAHPAPCPICGGQDSYTENMRLREENENLKQELFLATRALESMGILRARADTGAEGREDDPR